MARALLDAAGGGRVDGGPADGWSVRARERNGEVWLASSPALADAGPGDDDRADLLRALADAALASEATVVHWETDDAEEAVEAVAAAAGLPDVRAILQLRRPLPLDAEARAGVAPVAARPLRPGTADEAAWVRVNNRAFADHPDQGAETVASLRAAMAEPWFDAGGFLVLDAEPAVDEGGELDGFCWTKVHPATADDPVLGEIYVIGVDPRAGGRGLGPALVVAGLDHLAGRGVGTAVLYVDAANTPARRLYDRLGFGLHHTRWVRSRTADGADDEGQATG